MGAYKNPENWASFPVKEVLMGGVKKKIKVDLETNTIYLLDERGDWTGEKAQMPAPKPAQSAEAAKPAKENGAAEKEDTDSEDEEVPPAPIPKKKKQQKSKLTPVLIIIIIILAAMLLMQNNGGGSFMQQTYKVMVAMENIQPGDNIEGKLASVVISSEEYQKYAALGGLYYSNNYSDIKHYKATTFIPKDGYISYANVAEIFQVTNPWTQSSAASTIILPIDAIEDDLAEFIWGNEVNITITVKRNISSVKSEDAYRPTAPDVEGSTTIQTTQIDTYTLTAVPIVDMLNSKKVSLYSTYASMAAIPELYRKDCMEGRYASEEKVYADVPHYIRVKVSPETAEWWKAVTSRKNEIQVSLKIKGTYFDSELQNSMHLAMKAVMPYVQAAWDGVKE